MKRKIQIVEFEGGTYGVKVTEKFLFITCYQCYLQSSHHPFSDRFSTIELAEHAAIDYKKLLLKRSKKHKVLKTIDMGEVK